MSPGHEAPDDRLLPGRNLFGVKREIESLVAISCHRKAEQPQFQRKQQHSDDFFIVFYPFPCRKRNWQAPRFWKPAEFLTCLCLVKYPGIIQPI